MEKPDLDFTIDHQYGKGHNTMYEYIASEKWAMFPSRKDILSGIGMCQDRKPYSLASMLAFEKAISNKNRIWLYAGSVQTLLYVLAKELTIIE